MELSTILSIEYLQTLSEIELLVLSYDLQASFEKIERSRQMVNAEFTRRVAEYHLTISKKV